MKKKLLVTGASGFVGSHLVERAFAAGFEVHAAVRRSSKVEGIAPYVHRFAHPDFARADDLKKLFDAEGYDYVIHAAALTKAKSEAEMSVVNAGYTKNLLDAAFGSLYPPVRFVFVSSLAAVGPTGYDAPLMDESEPYHPVTMYGRSKRRAEEIVRSAFADKPVTIIRPTAVYGPRERDLFLLFSTMNRGLDAYIGRKPQKLSFIYVKDLVDALLSACARPGEEGLEIFNLTDGQVYPRYAMADIFRKLTGKRPMRVHFPYFLVKTVAGLSQWLYKNARKTPVLYPERLNELTAPNWGCDVSSAERVLGFRPEYGLEDGLQETLFWYRQNKWL